MITVGVTQRVLPQDPFGVRYDALDPQWHTFLGDCGLTGVPLPNVPKTAVAIAEALGLVGLLLTGGQDLAHYGGDAACRDDTERSLLGWATRAGYPVLGVCRGMQLILDAYGCELAPVGGHVAVEHEAIVDGTPRVVNCYHRWAARRVAAPLAATGWKGEIVESVRHATSPILGIMWHPERRPSADPGRQLDVAMIARFFA